MDHIYIACLRLYFLNYLDSYRYAPKLRHVSSAIAETAETAGVELDQEKWPDDVPDLKQEVWPDTVPDLQPEKWHVAVPGLKPEESAHAFGDLEEMADFEVAGSDAFRDLEGRGCAISVVDFEESADDAVSVDFERLCNPFSIG